MAHTTARLDLTGQRFGLLTVVARAENVGPRTAWLCRCDCGGERVVKTVHLRAGKVKSCGCVRALHSDSALGLHYVDGTCVEQIRSRKISSSNTSGVRGVYYSSREARWKAQITFKGKTKYLGSYKNLEDAAKARYAAEEIFDDFLREYDKKEEARAAL